MYMADIARWGAMDPMAESNPDFSTYRYGFNNPVMFTDPNEMLEKATIDKVWNLGGGWTNTGDGFENDQNIKIGYDGSYLSLNTKLEITDPDDVDINLPELVLNGYGRAKHWGGAISTYNINHGILYNGIDAMRQAWNEAVFQANQPVKTVLHNGSAYMMGGDLLGISDLVGIGLNRVAEDHPYAAMALAVAAVVATKGRAADDVLKTETRVFRAVNDVELASINSTGKSLEDAHLFGKQLYPDGYTVVEGVIYNSNNPMKYWSPGTDGIGAFIFNQKILKAIKPIIKQ